jgi:hypothetical protein
MAGYVSLQLLNKQTHLIKHRSPSEKKTFDSKNGSVNIVDYLHASNANFSTMYKMKIFAQQYLGMPPRICLWQRRIRTNLLIRNS